LSESLIAYVHVYFFHREPFIPLLDVLRKALPDIMRRDVLAQVSAVFVFAIARAILTLPVPVWKVCDSVMKNSNLGEQTVLHLLLHCMFCIVLDDPEGFGLVSGSEQDRQLRKGLLMISDMVKLLVVAKEDKSNTDMNKFIVESGATIRAVVSQWLVCYWSLTVVAFALLSGFFFPLCMFAVQLRPNHWSLRVPCGMGNL
jgi:hypothetical protein